MQEALRKLAGGAHQPGGQPTVVLDGGVAGKWDSHAPTVREGRHGDQPRAVRQARQLRHLERAPDGRCWWRCQVHRATLVRSVRGQAALRGDIQAVQRPLLHRERGGYRGPLAQSSRPCGLPCVDEKTQIQALDGTQRVLPLCGGYAEVSARDCVRHGTTKLFAALDLTTGKVLARCDKRHRQQEWIAFVQLIDRETSEDLDIPLARDSCASHKHARCGPRLPGGRACTCTSRRPMARR